MNVGGNKQGEIKQTQITHLESHHTYENNKNRPVKPINVESNILARFNETRTILVLVSSSNVTLITSQLGLLYLTSV
jgi:fatty acid desaturase